MMHQLPADPRNAIRAAHHQIGNSLQSVASLLREEGRAASPECAGVLLEASRRVAVVVRLHQRLQETDGDVVRLDDLIGDICRDVAALDAVERDARVVVASDPCLATAETASAIAMIAAELIGNALEHGLRSRAGCVRVDLALIADGCRLRVEDDGVGLGREPDGFGLGLVRALVRQLKGSFSIHSSGNGVRAEVVAGGAWPA